MSAPAQSVALSTRDLEKHFPFKVLLVTSLKLLTNILLMVDEEEDKLAAEEELLARGMASLLGGEQATQGSSGEVEESMVETGDGAGDLEKQHEKETGCLQNLQCLLYSKRSF